MKVVEINLTINIAIVAAVSGIGNFNSLKTIHKEFKVHASLSIHTVMLNVLGPGLAFHVNEHTRGRLREMHKDKWRQVAGLVGEGEIFKFNALLGIVSDGANILLVSGVLSLASDVNQLAAVAALGIIILDKLRNVLVFQFFGAVRLRNPVVDSVKLNQDTRITAFVTEKLVSAAVV